MHSDSLGIGFWMAFALIAAVCPLLLVLAKRLWHNQWSVADRPPNWWLWGPALFRGSIRATPLAVADTCALVLVGLATALWSSHRDDATYRLPIYLLAPIWLGLFVLMGCVVLFNRPRALVPPHLRQQPGAIHEWLSSRAGSRRATG
jgi:hypothetical protein